MLLTLLLACRDPGQEPRALVESVGSVSNTAVVWNGFRQAWGYNHRVNNLADYVRPVECDEDGCTASMVHAAASGSGTDEAAWHSRYTGVTAPGTRFLGGTSRIDIDLDDAEGQLITFTTTITVPDVPELSGQDRVHALLNGFDLLATEDADKLAHFTVLLGEPTIDGDDATFPVDVALLLDCDSVECDGTFQTDTSVHYELLVSWLLVGGGDGLAVTPVSAETAYAWDNRGLDDELRLSDLLAADVVTGEPERAGAVLAFTGLSVDLDDDHHMAEWASLLEPGRYDATTGSLPFEANLGFKQWNAGTWWNPVSYTSPGAAAMRADLLMLQFDDACVTTGDLTGTIQWKANGGPASEAAVAERSIPVRTCG